MMCESDGNPLPTSLVRRGQLVHIEMVIDSFAIVGKSIRAFGTDLHDVFEITSGDAMNPFTNDLLLRRLKIEQQSAVESANISHCRSKEPELGTSIIERTVLVFQNGNEGGM